MCYAPSRHLVPFFTVNECVGKHNPSIHERGSYHHSEDKAVALKSRVWPCQDVKYSFFPVLINYFLLLSDCHFFPFLPPAPITVFAFLAPVTAKSASLSPKLLTSVDGFSKLFSLYLIRYWSIKLARVLRISDIMSLTILINLTCLFLR